MAANNILLMRKPNHVFLLLEIANAWKMHGRSLRFPKTFIEIRRGDRMIKQLLNSVNVVVKYHYLSISRRSIICRSLRLRQIIDLLTTDKSRYFVPPRPITVNDMPKSVERK